MKGLAGPVLMPAAFADSGAPTATAAAAAPPTAAKKLRRSDTLKASAEAAAKRAIVQVRRFIFCRLFMAEMIGC